MDFEELTVESFFGDMGVLKIRLASVSDYEFHDIYEYDDVDHLAEFFLSFLVFLISLLS